MCEPSKTQMSDVHKLKRVEIAPNVYQLHFEHRRSLCSTFLRFQEHYESPQFRGKIFSLEEYKEWYVTFAPRAKKTGTFTYYGDWSGFNIPSSVLTPFKEGKFDPLSSNEKKLLGTFTDLGDNLFYVIGTFGQIPKPSVLKHEIAHGFFATNPKYRESALEIVANTNAADKKGIIKYLAGFGGYHPSVYLDETHAYLLTNCEKMIKDKIISPKSLESQQKLKDLFDKYYGQK